LIGSATGAVNVGHGAKEMDCGEGVDVASLDLGGAQPELVKVLRASGAPLAVVLIQGRPHSIPWIAANCPAIRCAWYPEQVDGRAVAEALFNDLNPSGRLPCSVPRSSGQLPDYHNYKFNGDAAFSDLDGTPL